MSLTIVDVTNESPTINSSEAFVAYKDLGPRPTCAACPEVDESCGSDGCYVHPVVAGDTIYLQYHLNDEYNSDPQNPTYGWKNGGAEYYIAATLLFQDGSSLALDEGGSGYAASIILGQEVGYFNGSYQTLILSSQKIKDYLNSIPNDEICFKVAISTYKQVAEEFISILGFYDTSPTPSSLDYTLTPYAVIADVLSVIEDGAWVPYSGDITIVYDQKTGIYYELVEGVWVEHTLEFTTEQSTTCDSYSYKFVSCDEFTQVVEGYHGETDCRNNYYGGTVQFRDRYRIWASFEVTGFSDEKVYNDDNVVTSFESYENWLLRLTKGMPYSVAERFHNTILANAFYVGVNAYTNISNLEKNNENGLFWWSQITMERNTCKKVQNCVDEVIVNPILICEETECPEVGEPVDLIGELGDYISTAACGSTKIIPAATVEDTEGNVLGQVDAGETIIIDCSGGDPSATCDPATVENSDSSFTQEVESGATLVLEDYTVNVYYDGVLVDTQTAPAMTDIAINISWT